MGAITTNIGRVSALVLCAGMGVALTGATGGTFLAAMAGSAMGGAAGNFFHQIVDGVLSWLGERRRGTTTIPANNDLDGLTACAIRLVFERARDNLSTDDPKRNVLERLAKTPLATIVAAMHTEETRLVGEAEIVGTLGSPAGGQTTTVATPDFWRGFVEAILQRTGADEVPSTLNTPVRDWTHIFTLAAKALNATTRDLLANDVTARGKDPAATDAVAFTAGLLHTHVAAFANNVLRDTFGPQGRFFVAALFHYLNTIATAVTQLPAGVAPTTEQGAQIKAWVKESTREALAAGRALPAPQTDEERAAAAELQAQADALGATLKQMGEHIVYIRAGMARWCDTLAPDLVLPPRVTVTERNRFVFRSRRLSVFGRDEELAELNAWLDSTASFSWDLWVGPAGSGKSRLALELCDRRLDWDAGFFSFNGPHTPNWRDWIPKTDTLVIFDYVAENAERIGYLVDLFARRAAANKEPPLPPGVKVRFLLLERAALRNKEGPNKIDAPGGGDTATRNALIAESSTLEAPWLSVLRAAASYNGADVQSVYARKDLQSQGRYLGGVSPEAVIQIVREDASLANDRPASQQLSERLYSVERIDSHFRPLFVAMAAEAHREHAGIADFDQLVQYVQEKEWKHARVRLHAHQNGPGASDEAWAKLVCLATMCEGLRNRTDQPEDGPLTDALKLPSTLGLPTDSEYDDGSRYAMLISGASSIEAPKLEPDIVGEAMVLHRLAKLPRQRPALINAAWQLGMDGFVARCAQNFPALMESSGLLNPTRNALPLALAAAHTALSLREAEAGGKSALAVRGRRLLFDKSQPSAVRAVGAYMWQPSKVTRHDAERWLAACDELIAIPSSDSTVRENLAKALFNAFNSAPANSALARSAFARLQSMADADLNDLDVCEPFARGLVNAIAVALDGDENISICLARLQALADANPSEAVLRESLAKGLFNAFNRVAADSDSARHLLGRLQKLSFEHRADAQLRNILSMAMFNAFVDAPADSDAARNVLARLHALADANPADAAVNKHATKGDIVAFLNSVKLGSPQPEHILSMAARMPRLAAEMDVQDITVRLLADLERLGVQAVEPLNSELKIACIALRAAYQARFPTAS